MAADSAQLRFRGSKYCMKVELRNNGTVLLIVVFVVALLSAVVMGILQLNTEEIQLMHNQINAAQALATAEAGLNYAFSRIRQGSDANIIDESFNGGLYSANFSDGTVTSTGTTAEGFVARVDANITVGSSSPYIVRIDNLRINE